MEAEAASASSRRPSGKVRVGDQPQRHGRIVLRQPEAELIYRHTWTSRHNAELAIFAWIEGWYNPERIIAGLGMRSPDEYEAAFYADTTNANPDTLVKVGNRESSLQ